MNAELNRRRNLATQELGRSVVALAPENSDAFCGSDSFKKSCLHGVTFGVKNTDVIPHELIRRLIETGNYHWLTIDKMADKGRSIDTDLINPITYRLMTGSTSGGAVNILKGFNDFALGTDGGGSVLGSAAAVNLYSIIGAGLGDAALAVGNEELKKDSVSFVTEAKSPLSTDNLSYVPSVGVIAKSIKQAIEALFVAVGIEIDDSYEMPTIKVAIPKAGTLQLPTGEDMRVKLNVFINASNFDTNKVVFCDFDASGIQSRPCAVEKLNTLFNDGFDIVMTYEGPVDLYGYDETIPQSFSGVATTMIAGKGGKYMIKAANMAHSTAVTLPSNEIASCIVLCAKPGLDGAYTVSAFARALESFIPTAPLFKRYFLDQQKQNTVFNIEQFCAHNQKGE